MESAKNVSANNHCHDCKKEIKLNGEVIENGVYLNYDNAGEMVGVFKCNDCYDKNKTLTNFQKCEVYSRIVGYIRPVAQWNHGKKQEYSERQEYTITGGTCC